MSSVSRLTGAATRASAERRVTRRCSSRRMRRRGTRRERWRHFVAPAVWAQCSGAIPTTTQRSGRTRRLTLPGTSAHSDSGEAMAHRNPRSPRWQRSWAPNVALSNTPTHGSTSSGTRSGQTRAGNCLASTAGTRAPFRTRASAPSLDASKRSRMQVTGPAHRFGRSPQPTNARCARGEELQRTDFLQGQLSSPSRGAASTASRRSWSRAVARQIELSAAP